MSSTFSSQRRTPHSSRAQRGWEFSPRPKDPAQDFFVWPASSPSDFEDVEYLWRKVYGDECGWLPSSTGPLLKDQYGDQSTYLLAKCDGRTVGTMRLVMDGPHALPIEQFTGIDDLRSHGRRLMECQRLMLLPDYRNKSWPQQPYGVLAALVKGCIHWCLVNNVTHIVADVFTSTPTTPIGPLLALGFEETGIEFVDTELVGSGESRALLLEVAELFSRPFRTDAPFYRYLMEYDNFIDVYT